MASERRAAIIVIVYLLFVVYGTLLSMLTCSLKVLSTYGTRSTAGTQIMISRLAGLVVPRPLPTPLQYKYLVQVLGTSRRSKKMKRTPLPRDQPANRSNGFSMSEFPFY